MPQDPQKLPAPTFEASKAYTIKGSTLNALIEKIIQITPIAGANITVQQVPTGTIINAGAEGDASGGAFFTLVEIETGPNAGDIYLQGGSVNGDAVNTSDLKLYDAGTTNWGGADDEQLYLAVAGTGVVADGVLLPGFEISGITVSIGSPPVDDPPTKDDPSGTAYLSLGTFFNDQFFPAIAGNRNVSVCIGTFVKTAGA